MVSPPRPHGICNNQNRYNHEQMTCYGNLCAYSMSTTPTVVLVDGYSLVLFNKKPVPYFNGYQWIMKIKKV